MIVLSDFIKLFNGHWCDWDGSFGNQCFDLAQFYNSTIGNPTSFTGATADLIINQAGTFYTKVLNSPTGFPVAGDIVVWSWPHVGIATGNNTNSSKFEVLEQNDPTNSNCHIKVYPNYNGVIGWLHPNSLPQDPQSIIDELRTARDANYNSYQAELTKNNTLASQLQDEQNKNQQLREANDSLTSADSATGAELLDVSHERDDYLNRLNSIKDALPSPSISLVDLLSTIDNLRKPTDDILATTQAQLSECFANLQTSKITTFKQWLSYGWNLLTHK